MNDSRPGPGVTRRGFLGAAALAPATLSVAGRWLPGGDARSLVVLELAGGNDGLNTIVPVDDPAWVKARPTLGAVRSGAHRIADDFALHPAMGELAKLFERGVCSAIHAVGYEPPDRSHFRSRDIWMAADPALTEVAADTTGWLGRIADELAESGAAVPALSVGSLQVPLALRGRRVVVPSLRRIEDYQLVVDPAGEDVDRRRREVAELVESAGDGSTASLTSFVAEVARVALQNERQLRTALARYAPRAAYPEGSFGAALQLLARVLVSGFGTRLFHLTLGGFDTHASQAPAHAGLLRQLSSGLSALVTDLERHGAFDALTILVHSEFGRRVAENRSQGTDHGAAGPVFVLGVDVEGPLCGTFPGLDDLIDGDLRPTTDFRDVYDLVRARSGLPRG